MSDPNDSGVNPPFNVVDNRPTPKGALFEYHLNNGSLEAFYELYPESRPDFGTVQERERER